MPPSGSDAAGVRHTPSPEDEDPLSSVRCPNFGRPYTRPFRIEPERGQRPEYLRESPSTNESWDILQKDPLGFHLTNDTRDIRPDPPRIGDSGTGTGGGPGLTWESRCDDIHRSTPSSAVEGSNLIPNRCLVQSLVRHPRHDNGRRVAVAFDITHNSGAGDRETDPEVETSDPGADG